VIHSADAHISAIELFDQLDKSVDIIVDDQSPVGYRVSTIVDLTEDEPVVLRKGLGWDAVADLGLVEAEG
jgi:tRNA A37 threonylcarbamoyladenosine synthetase subunit TsaC/SUA5/YrdC